MKTYTFNTGEIFFSHALAVIAGVVLTVLALILIASYTNMVPETATFTVVGPTADGVQYTAHLTYEKRETELRETARQACIGSVMQDDLKLAHSTVLLGDAAHSKEISPAATPFRSAIKRAERECETTITRSSFNLKIATVWGIDPREGI